MTFGRIVTVALAVMTAQMINKWMGLDRLVPI